MRQIIIWHNKVETARTQEVGDFQNLVNRKLAELGDKVEKVYTIGVGHDMVVTAVVETDELIIVETEKEKQKTVSDEEAGSDEV